MIHLNIGCDGDDAGVGLWWRLRGERANGAEVDWVVDGIFRLGHVVGELVFASCGKTHALTAIEGGEEDVGVEATEDVFAGNSTVGKGLRGDRKWHSQADVVKEVGEDEVGHKVHEGADSGDKTVLDGVDNQRIEDTLRGVIRGPVARIHELQERGIRQSSIS